MKTIVRTIRKYVCTICRTSYGSKKKAEQCERRLLEKKVFRVGDSVEAKEDRFCQKKQRAYHCFGRVRRIVGPQPPDEEYELKWLRGSPDRLNSHVYEYEISFNCPCCGEPRRERYFAPELRRKVKK